MSQLEEDEHAHIPVLLKEILDLTDLKPGENVIDCTVGAGGHSEAFLKQNGPDGKLLGFDLDEVALESARKRLSLFGSRAMLVHGNYKDVGNVLLSASFGPVHAVLLDLGFSSMEIDDPTRGFSFRFDGPLDMRFDKTQELTAADIVNSWSADELARIFWVYGEERFGRRVADRIAIERKKKHITGTFQLVEIIRAAMPGFRRRQRLHYATKIFQALRIATNDELENMKEALPPLLDALEPGGRLGVISFHSLEDRIVKRFFKEKEAEGVLEIITKKPVEAGEEEIKQNSRARSAKYRIAKKL